ncbi:hypothetical protein J1N35_009008 [Gossypium stocksii]|uniref:Uncharacterized protein n=1 Tax=Gossypium stocksii TaxID=47602 RepID=A0A9D3WBW7_9ROSI|nr:hypothetical protein J1N35_009008 [Gossypium stocksii]
MPTSQNSATEEVQEHIVFATQNFNKSFKKQSRRIKKFEASTNVPKNISNGEVIKEESGKDEKKGENNQLKDENAKLVKQVEAKESLIAEELDNFVKVKKELGGIKLMLEKFNTRSSKPNEILVARKEEPIKGGLGFVDKGKAVMGSPIVFVKASGLKEVSERPKPIVFKLSKKIVHSRKVIYHYCGTPGHIRPH